MVQTEGSLFPTEALARLILARGVAHGQRREHRRRLGLVQTFVLRRAKPAFAPKAETRGGLEFSACF